jgi:hypothetical protein
MIDLPPVNALVVEALTADFAPGKVIIGLEQFRWRKRLLAISFDEWFCEMFVHFIASIRSNPG